MSKPLTLDLKVECMLIHFPQIIPRALLYVSFYKLQVFFFNVNAVCPPKRNLLNTQKKNMLNESWSKKQTAKLEEPHDLISECSTKLQWSKQRGPAPETRAHEG